MQQQLTWFECPNIQWNWRTVRSFYSRYFEHESILTSEVMADRMTAAETRLRETNLQLQKLADQHSKLMADIEPDALSHALQDFDEIWNVMPSRRQKRLLQLLSWQIDYDGATSRISLYFHPHGFECLTESLRQNAERSDTRTARRSYCPF